MQYPVLLMSLGIIGQVGFDRFMALKYYYSGPLHSQPLNTENCLSPWEPNHCVSELGTRAVHSLELQAGVVAFRHLLEVGNNSVLVCVSGTENMILVCTPTVSSTT